MGNYKIKGNKKQILDIIHIEEKIKADEDYVCRFSHVVNPLYPMIITFEDVEFEMIWSGGRFYARTINGEIDTSDWITDYYFDDTESHFVLKPPYNEIKVYYVSCPTRFYIES